MSKQASKFTYGAIYMHTTQSLDKCKADAQRMANEYKEQFHVTTCVRGVRMVGSDGALTFGEQTEYTAQPDAN